MLHALDVRGTAMPEAHRIAPPERSGGYLVTGTSLRIAPRAGLGSGTCAGA